ncbi:MAG: glutaredoxin 3 [Trichodesmium sp. St11_bin5]|nr:glutaredoxin 3 [Trichodesmium sp. St11_bin5]MDT9339069.1 glutaredoxin 3 [Trichodesmium erythraeum 21-75]
MSVNIEIYTWSSCPFCFRAKALLDKKQVNYQEYLIDGNDIEREKMADRANGRNSLPQIFIDEEHIGGCDDLYGLEAQGKLDPLLQR